jgi:hypothetical protein
MASSFKQGATADFNPELIHVKTPEEAAKLPAPALVYVFAATALQTYIHAY